MRIQQLRYLEKIATTGSINEAAKQLFISQPSLSQAMKELEKEYQVQLFYRHKTGITLTDTGREFINYSRSVLDQVNLPTNILVREPFASVSLVSLRNTMRLS